MNPYRVKPDRRLNLRDLDPRESGDFKSEEEAEDRTEQLKQKLETLQERLYGERSRAVLVVLQGMDTSGKDGTARHIMRSVNPQGGSVTSFNISGTAIWWSPSASSVPSKTWIPARRGSPKPH